MFAYDKTQAFSWRVSFGLAKTCCDELLFGMGMFNNTVLFRINGLLCMPDAADGFNFPRYASTNFDRHNKIH